MRGVKKFTALAAAAAFVSGPASAACWSSSAIDAAYVRDFDTILMVATLRCRTQGVDVATDYNKFVRAKRVLLTAANEELRTQFSAGKSKKAGLDAFDRFATALANSHGAGSDDFSCVEYKTLAQAAVAAAPNRAAILQLAARAGANPALPKDACASGQIALAR